MFLPVMKSNKLALNRSLLILCTVILLFGVQASQINTSVEVELEYYPGHMQATSNITYQDTQVCVSFSLSVSNGTHTVCSSTGSGN